MGEDARKLFIRILLLVVMALVDDKREVAALADDKREVGVSDVDKQVEGVDGKQGELADGKQEVGVLDVHKQEEEVVDGKLLQPDIFHFEVNSHHNMTNKLQFLGTKYYTDHQPGGMPCQLSVRFCVDIQDKFHPCLGGRFYSCSF